MGPTGGSTNIFGEPGRDGEAFSPTISLNGVEWCIFVGGSPRGKLLDFVLATTSGSGDNGTILSWSDEIKQKY